MENYTPLHKQLREILTQRDFSRLSAFQSPSTWTVLTSDERHLLGMLFVAKGEHQLREGDNKVMESFSLASQVASDNPQVFFQQAVAYATQNRNLRCLNEACKALASAVELDPQFFDAWHAWGSILVLIGEIHGKGNFFQEADKKFEKAQIHAQNIEPAKMGSLYWQWGLCWQSLGQLSGEAHDFYYAIDKFRKALDFSYQNHEYWNDFGNTVAMLGMLIGKKELFFEAIELFRKVISMTPDYFQGWLNLGSTYQRLFEQETDEAYFQSAYECFVRAAELNSKSLDLWMCWGKLFLDSGKVNYDIEQLRISSEKFELANSIEPNHPDVLRFLAEAQMMCGAYLERLDLMRQAEQKIIHSLELNAENVDAWYVYGTCLTELGRYFSDEALYVKAIEKYQYGLTLNSQHARLWYGLALAHYALAELQYNPKLCQESANFCAKVIECGGQAVPQFWNDWGVTLLKLAEMTHDQTNVELAIEKLEKAIGSKDVSDLDPSQCDLEYVYNYGCAYDFLGDNTEDARDYEKAIQILSFVVKQDPSYTHARYNLALALSHLGELEEDIESFHKSLEQFQILLSQDAEDEAAWNDWGMTLLHLGQLLYDPIHPMHSLTYYEQAEEKFTHAIALGHASSFYNLACLYSLIGNNTAAMHYIERSEASGALPSIDDIMHDEWLIALREMPEFKSFIALLSNRHPHENK